jgi:hypothetical protein
VVTAAVRVLPPALLLVLVMIGLRGAIGTPRFNGPLKQDGPLIGAGLAAVLTALLIATVIRHRRYRLAHAADDPDELDTAAKLRAVLLVVLPAGIAADIITILVGLHLKLFTLPQHIRKPATVRLPSGGHRPPPGRVTHHVSGLSGTLILYILLIVAVLVVIVAITRWARMLRLPAALAEDEPIAEETEETLRAAIEKGRRALLSVDDTRAAIIACYAAMEETLAERGTARKLADTPDELLARATKAGFVKGPAARTLTRLFYEARFSTHPMSQAQRAGAELCLDELTTEVQPAGEPMR